MARQLGNRCIITDSESSTETYTELHFHWWSDVEDLRYKHTLCARFHCAHTMLFASAMTPDVRFHQMHSFINVIH